MKQHSERGQRGCLGIFRGGMVGAIFPFFISPHPSPQIYKNSSRPLPQTAQAL